MSHYVECKTKMTDTAALVDALVAMGYAREHIELHEVPQSLYGYENRARPERANIIIRRQYVGNAANDIGWQRAADGTLQAFISEFDGRHNFTPMRQAQLAQEYSAAVVCRQARASGRTVQRTVLPDGRIQLAIAGYR